MAEYQNGTRIKVINRPEEGAQVICTDDGLINTLSTFFHSRFKGLELRAEETANGHVITFPPKVKAAELADITAENMGISVTYRNKPHDSRTEAVFYPDADHYVWAKMLEKALQSVESYTGNIEALRRKEEPELSC